MTPVIHDLPTDLILLTGTHPMPSSLRATLDALSRGETVAS